MEYRSVARVVKTHGKKGEVVAVPANGLPFVLRPGLHVALVPPQLKGDRWHDVTDVQTSDAGQLVRFSGVDDLNAAGKIVGKSILVLRDDLPSDFDLHDVDALLGRSVISGGGEVVGVISEVMQGPANDVWVVDGDGGELLLPVIADVVRTVPGTGPIVVDLPEGMFSCDGGGDE